MSKKAKAGPLEPYRGKRRFEKTPEPEGAPRAAAAGGPIFVVQKHKARTLHYDFRLEVDGVLKSWAVPKGPSVNPKDKRLAVMVEDHPLEYAAFEGTIPADEYGAGPVIVWDAGTYRHLPEEGGPATVAAALEAGFLQVHLEGQKLRGGFKLIHARLGGGEKNWLLVKKHDDGADAARDPVRDEPQSVLSGRTIEDLLAEQG